MHSAEGHLSIMGCLPTPPSLLAGATMTATRITRNVPDYSFVAGHVSFEARSTG